jgi:ribosomal protein S18 acetylase RimI-like enzyme
MPSVSVRPAVAADAASISEVVRESWLYSNRDLLPDDSARSVMHCHRLAEVVVMNWRSILVAEYDGRTVGAVGINEQGHFWMLYVLPNYQGLGVGSSLYDAAIARLRKGGAAKAMLEVLAANENAVAFYRARGWVPEGRRTEHIPGFRFTALRMGLALA